MTPHSAIEIRLGADEGVVFVHVRVPQATDIHILDAIKSQVHELFSAVEQMDGRQPQNFVTQEAHGGDSQNYNCVVWSREYSDPAFPARFEVALRALAEAGIVAALH